MHWVYTFLALTENLISNLGNGDYDGIVTDFSMVFLKFCPFNPILAGRMNDNKSREYGAHMSVFLVSIEISLHLFS